MTPILSSSQFRSIEGARKRFAIPLIVGGILWIAHYVLQIAIRWQNQQVDWGTPLGIADGLCFSGAIIGFCYGLLALTSTFATRRGGLRFTGQTFAVIAALSATVSLVGALLHQRPGVWGGVGVSGSCLSATFVALATKKAGTTPAYLSNLLLLIGLLTFPLIIAVGWAADMWGLGFATDELPFALTGMAYIAFVRLLLKSSA